MVGNTFKVFRRHKQIHEVFCFLGVAPYQSDKLLLDLKEEGIHLVVGGDSLL